MTILSPIKVKPRKVTINDVALRRAKDVALGGELWPRQLSLLWMFESWGKAKKGMSPTFLGIPTVDANGVTPGFGPSFNFAPFVWRTGDTLHCSWTATVSSDGVFAEYEILYPFYAVPGGLMATDGEKSVTIAAHWNVGDTIYLALEMVDGQMRLGVEGVVKSSDVPASMALMWPKSSDQEGVTESYWGVDPEWGYAGPQYDENGNFVGLQDPTYNSSLGKWEWGGTQYTNTIPTNRMDIRDWVQTNASVVHIVDDVYKLVDTTVAGNHSIYTSIGAQLSGCCTVQVKADEISTCQLTIYNSTNTHITRCFVNLIDGTIVNLNGVSSSKHVGDGWYEVSMPYIATVANSSLYIYPAKGGVTNYAGNGTDGFLTRRVQSTSINVPKPYVIPGTTVYNAPVPAYHAGKGVWCGPSYTNIGQSVLLAGADNATSTELQYVSPVASPVVRVTENTTSGEHVITFNNGGNFAPGVTDTISAYIKADTHNFARVHCLTWAAGWVATGTARCSINLSTGETHALNSGIIESATLQSYYIGDGWYYIACSFKIASTATASDLVSRQAAVGINLNLTNYNYTGNGARSILVSGYQFTATSVPMPYVPPGTTVVSAAGTSTNNGLRWGMDPVEYVPDGVELVQNGGFDSGVEGWSVNLNGVLTNEAGKLRVAALTQAYGQAYQAVSTIVGAKYRISGAFFKTTYSCAVKVGTVVNGNQFMANVLSASQTFSYEFTATTTTTFVTLAVENPSFGAGYFVEFDNISVQRIIPRINIEKRKIIESLRGKPDGVELFTSAVVANTAIVTLVSPGVYDVSTVPGGGANGLRTSMVADTTSGKLFVCSISNFIGSTVEIRGYTSSYVLTGSNAVNKNGFFVTEFSKDTQYFYVCGFSANGGCRVSNISIQKLLPAKCTVAAVVTMGVGFNDLQQDGSKSVLSARDVVPDLMMFQRFSSTGGNISASNDGITTANKDVYDPNIWSRNETHLKVVQISNNGAQFRTGNKRIDIDLDIKWGVWRAFDGSYNPLTYLRAALTSNLPLHLAGLQVWDEPEVDEATIEQYFRKNGVL